MWKGSGTNAYDGKWLIEVVQRLVRVEGRRDRPELGVVPRLARRVDGEAVAVGVLLADWRRNGVGLGQTTALARDDPLLRLRRNGAVLGRAVVFLVG